MFGTLPPNKEIRIIGTGTFARVTRNEILSTKEHVAIKHYFCEDSNDISGGILREVTYLNMMKGCTNVVKLIDVEMKMICERIIVSVMMSCHTRDLHWYIAGMSTFQERINILDRVVNDLLNGLSEIHRLNIIHRDIKPLNILIDDDRCYYADFGLSCIFTSQTDVQNTNVYTPLYRPPEIIIKSSYELKADVWALGATLVEFICGLPIIYNRHMDYDDEDDEERTMLISRILLLCVNNHTYDDFLNMKTKIHDTIDVDRFLKQKLTSDGYKCVPKHKIELVTKMLNINPADRPNINDLIIIDSNVNFVNKFNIISRGNIPIDSDITTNMYYVLVNWLLDVAGRFRLNLRSVVSGIDLIERYIANYNITKNKFQLLGLVCIRMMDKMLDAKQLYMIDCIRLCKDIYSIDQFKEMELLVFSRMNYILVNNEFERFIGIIGNKSYIRLLRTHYETLKNENKYAGCMSYDELCHNLQTII